MELSILNLPAREWTTTEELDIGSFFGFPAFELTDSRFVFPFGWLEAVGDNLYRITWDAEVSDKEGPFTLFCSLHQALETMGTVTTRSFS